MVRNIVSFPRILYTFSPNNFYFIFVFVTSSSSSSLFYSVLFLSIVNFDLLQTLLNNKLQNNNFRTMKKDWKLVMFDTSQYLVIFCHHYASNNYLKIKSTSSMKWLKYFNAISKLTLWSKVTQKVKFYIVLVKTRELMENDVTAKCMMGRMESNTTGQQWRP